MPSLDAHLAAAEHNIRAYKAIPDEFPGWKAVMVFYAAVHLVEAMFATKDIHHREHQWRETAIQRDHPALWKPYSRLKNESLKARYLAVGRLAGTDELDRSQFAMSAAQVHEQLHNKVLATIRGYVQQRLAKPAGARRKRAT